MRMVRKSSTLSKENCYDRIQKQPSLQTRMVSTPLPTNILQKKTAVKGHKIWKDEDNKDGIRPSSVTVKLLADGKETGQTATVSETNGWTYEFTGS